jgi:hypothetical protein
MLTGLVREGNLMQIFTLKTIFFFTADIFKHVSTFIVKSSVAATMSKQT